MLSDGLEERVWFVSHRFHFLTLCQKAKKVAVQFFERLARSHALQNISRESSWIGQLIGWRGRDLTGSADSSVWKALESFILISVSAGDKSRSPPRPRHNAPRRVTSAWNYTTRSRAKVR